MDKVTISSASLVFTAATVLVGLNIVLVSSTWKTLKSIISKQIDAERRIIINLKRIIDKDRKNREELKQVLYFGSVFFGLSIAAGTASLVGVAAIMLGLHSQNFLESDYNFSRYALLVSVSLFFLGMLCLGIWYGIEAFKVKTGKM